MATARAVAAFTAILVCLNISPVVAEPIQVHLFEAHPDLSRVIVKGPFAIISPVQLSFSRGTYEIIAAGSGRLEIRSGSSTVLSAARARVTAPGPAGLYLEA